MFTVRPGGTENSVVRFLLSVPRGRKIASVCTECPAGTDNYTFPALFSVPKGRNNTEPVEMPPVLAVALASSCSTMCTVPGKHQLQSPPTVRGGGSLDSPSSNYTSRQDKHRLTNRPACGVHPYATATTTTVILSCTVSPTA